MSWILTLILMASDGSQSSSTYPEGDLPERFTSQAECLAVGVDVMDSSDNNEYAHCVPIKTDEEWCNDLVVTDYGTQPPTKIIELGSPCRPGPLWGDGDAG